MIICFIGPSNSAHINKWCSYFLKQRYEIHIISFFFNSIEGVHIHHVESGANRESTDTHKIRYLFTSRKIKKIIETIRPDIISVHYATSYGTAVALSGIKDYCLSVWGSDVFEFPNKGFCHKLMLKYSLSKANSLLSTCTSMAIECQKYTRKKINITPFGVDMNCFTPEKRYRKNDKKIIIGTVKALSYVYGIEYIIKSAAIVIKRNPSLNIEVRIAGSGENKESLEKLSEDLGISEHIHWLGYISQEEASFEWANMDIAVIPSLAESFGVSAVEAQASGVPVVISNIPGLMESTSPGVTSIAVETKNDKKIADAIEFLCLNPTIRKKMGKNAREYVLKKYEYCSCFNKIERVLLENKTKWSTSN